MQYKLKQSTKLNNTVEYTCHALDVYLKKIDISIDKVLFYRNGTKLIHCFVLYCNNKLGLNYQKHTLGLSFKECLFNAFEDISIINLDIREGN